MGNSEAMAWVKTASVVRVKPARNVRVDRVSDGLEAEWEIVQSASNSFKVTVTVRVELRKVEKPFVATGETAAEAIGKVESKVRKELAFWRFIVGQNQQEKRFPRVEIPLEKRRVQGVEYTSASSHVLAAITGSTTQTRPYAVDNRY